MTGAHARIAAYALSRLDWEQENRGNSFLNPTACEWNRMGTNRERLKNAYKAEVVPLAPRYAPIPAWIYAYGGDEFLPIRM